MGDVDGGRGAEERWWDEQVAVLANEVGDGNKTRTTTGGVTKKRSVDGWRSPQREKA